MLRPQQFDVGALCLTIFLLAGSANAATDFDNASTHQQARFGSKTCFTTHYHSGISPSWPTKKGAQTYAIRQWVNFTTFEYGKKWGSYRLARSKTMDCQTTGGRWICETLAFPCRR